jgi:hypothetical protein
VLEGSPIARAGIVDKDIDPAKIRKHAANAIIDGSLIHDVELPDIKLDFIALRPLTQGRALSGFRSVAMTLKPDFARTAAAESPMPDEVPVIKTT